MSPLNKRVAGRLDPDTDFKYVGSIEECGWKPGQVPLFLEWYPKKLDRRGMLKFFESGREYVVGRASTCDIYFQNAEPDSGISSEHLKIKVYLISATRLTFRPSCVLDQSIESMFGLPICRRTALM